MIVNSPAVTARPLTPVPTTRQVIVAAVAKRAIPVVTAAAGAALATLAVERTVANLALRGAERTPLFRRPAAPEFTRVTVTHTTIVERITRPA